jgi:hypothetical protein
MRIPNTLHLREAYISESLLPEASRTPGITILGDPEPMRFDSGGWLADGWNFSSPTEHERTHA